MNIWLYRFLFITLIFVSSRIFGGNKIYFLDSSGTRVDSAQIEYKQLESVSKHNDHRPNPILQLIKKKQKKNKKIVAAILAFPFPFGIVGLHRIYLGTAPYVPVAYIGSLGGVFGILPFIDFCVLILDKDFDRYINNDKIFMWVK